MVPVKLVLRKKKKREGKKYSRVKSKAAAAEMLGRGCESGRGCVE